MQNSALTVSHLGQVSHIWALHLAAHKALTAAGRGLQRAHTLHAEIICNLSGSRHVGLPPGSSAWCCLQLFHTRLVYANQHVATAMRRQLHKLIAVLLLNRSQ